MIKIQLNTIDLSTRFWEITTIFRVRGVYLLEPGLQFIVLG